MTITYADLILNPFTITAEPQPQTLKRTMPYTIDQGFRQLRTNLEISNLQTSTVSTRQRNVREAVADRLSVETSFLTGSYMRSTMIAPLKRADIDIFLVMDAGYFDPNGQAALLDRVKRALLKTYKTPDISRNGRAVTIQFSDFIVDVVPGFLRSGGGYLIPDSRNKLWIATDPMRHVELWTETNKAHGGNFVPLIKMIKAWNVSYSRLLGSFHLETLARQVLTGITISSFPSGARFFFDRARALIPHVLSDPAGYPGGVGRTTQAERAGILSRMETALSRARAAEQLASNGNIEGAYDKWRLVFGGYFPAYG
ncbi:MAG: nucleotidyltransferase [Phycisphaerales bacterium]